MRRLILIPTLIVVALLAIAGGVGYWIYNNYMFYSTDDAQVSSTVVPINAPATGQLTTFTVKQGDTVTAGQTIATLTPAPATSTAGAPTKPTPINITSPISGTILQTTVVEGQTVAPGLALAQVSNLNTLKITAYVDEGQIDRVKTNQDVDIRIDAFSGTNFSGKIEQIVPATAGTFSLLPTQDNASGNFTKVGQRIPVLITLDGNSGKNLLPGMSATVVIHVH